MCGIAGIAGSRPFSAEDLSRMSATIAHRGPDDDGIYIAEGIGLAHRRLAIIDLSEAGHQPLMNETGEMAIVFNGEIYNHRDLVGPLQAAGHRFRSRSDTEVIIHAYEEWGADCVKRFNGMWAFAIWDGRTRTLFCSRDRMGVKPFYYAWLPDRLVFGSEIKAVLAAGVAARPDTSYLAHALVDVVQDDGPETFFAGIRQLPAAHSLVFDGGGAKVFRYWDYDPDRPVAEAGYPEPAEGVRSLLDDAVRLRIVASDVQVGSCLSGGIDSSSIVALASRYFDVPMASFSVSYDEPGFDESRYARIVAEKFGCDAHTCSPTGEGYLDVLRRITWHQDEPTIAQGNFSQWHVMELAKPHVKVLLDGQGGDELMAGYRDYLEIHMRELALGGRLATFARDLPAAARTWELPLPLALVRALGGEKARALYWRLRGAGSADDISADVREHARVHPVVRSSPRKSPDDLNDRLYYDLTRDIIPALLHYEDRISMAFSIEARTPFLDYRLVEYALSIPGSAKLAGGRTKSLLRSAMAGITPAEVLAREDKMGYFTPAGRWLRGPLGKDVRDRLLSPETRARGILDPATVKRKLDDHAAGKTDFSGHIYRWLTLEQWFESFIDSRDPSLGPETDVPSA